MFVIPKESASEAAPPSPHHDSSQNSISGPYGPASTPHLARLCPNEQPSNDNRDSNISDMGPPKKPLIRLGNRHPYKNLTLLRSWRLRPSRQHADYWQQPLRTASSRLLISTSLFTARCNYVCKANIKFHQMAGSTLTSLTARLCIRFFF